MQTCVIDPEAIENLRELNPGDDDEFLREIAGIFLDDTPQRIAELEQSLRDGDVVTFTRAAHSIKGSSSNLGAVALRNVAGTLENEAKTNGLAAVDSLMDLVRVEFERARAELSSLIAR